jgi:hypothetical protein
MRIAVRGPVGLRKIGYKHAASWHGQVQGKRVSGSAISDAPYVDIPVESMPPFRQTLSLINPLRHYITIVRDILLKGVGLDVIWPNVLALAAFAIIAIWISATRYRSQLR